MAEEAEAGGQGEGENVVIKWCLSLQDRGMWVRHGVVPVNRF